MAYMWIVLRFDECDWQNWCIGGV